MLNLERLRRCIDLYNDFSFHKANRNIDVAKLEPKEQERLKNLFKKKVSKL